MNATRYCAVILVGVIASTGGCRAPSPRPVAEITANTTEAKAEAKTDTVAIPAEEGDPLHPRILIATTLGDITLELDGEAAPATVINFVQYARTGYYNGTIFHRVLDDLMIHGGGYTPDVKKKIVPIPPAVVDPWMTGLKNSRGTIALVRGPGKGGSGAAEFFINVVDNTKLDAVASEGRSVVFGRVVEGMDTVEKIRSAAVAAHPGYAGNQSAVVPVKPIVIKSIETITRFNPIRLQAVLASKNASQDQLIAKLIAEFEAEAGRKAVTTDSGVIYIDHVIGDGPTSPILSDTVEFHYRGTLADGMQFESTYETKALVRKVDALIPGLQEGLETMREGGQRTIIIASDLAFGEGIPGKIPPGSTLIFEVELLSIK